MLAKIVLEFTETGKLEVPAQGVTIFVGPNNSGKSMALKEIEASISSTAAYPGNIVKDFEPLWPSDAQFQADIAALTKKAPSGTAEGSVYIGRYTPQGQLESATVNRQKLTDRFVAKNKYWMYSQFFKFFQIRLDGRTRFELTNDREMGDLEAHAANTLVHLFKEDKLRNEIREVVHESFGSYFILDPTKGGHLRIRLSNSKPEHDEQSLNEVAREFNKKALHIKDSSDGVQAFVGILIAVRSGDYRVILIDEPEAFLHPPLARKLGHELTATISKTGGSLMASTHSPDFLIGCLQASPQVRVVRLEYSNDKSKGQIVDSTALSAFFKKPLMRSANVISALFHDGVVVTESDNDRAFYAEIYYRLAEHEKGYPSLLFVNAQNKQTIREILGPLRAFGVPAVAICDIDILKDGGADWTGWLTAARFPEALHLGLGQQRSVLKKKYEDAGIDMKTGGGVDSLPVKADRDALNHLFDDLAQYGVFVTRKGELENWLPQLAIAGKKTDWTIAMLEKLGDDPASANYLKPSEGDVWAFIRSIVKWVRDPARKGTA